MVSDNAKGEKTMSKETAKAFLTAFRQKEPDEAFVNRFREVQSDDERLALYVEAAAAAGCDLTAADIRDALEELDAERKAKTQEAVQDLQALKDDDVEKVAGGFYYIGEKDGQTHQKIEGECVNDFTDDDCTLQDACHVFSNLYYDCDNTYYADACSWGDYVENGVNTKSHW